MAGSTSSRRTLFAAIGCLALAAPIGPVAPVARAGTAAPESKLLFADDAKLVAGHDLAWLEALSPREVRVYEPYEQGEVRFRGVPLPEVLDAAYGDGWRQREELLFTCRDGYRPTVPVKRVLAHRAWLVFDRADEDGFAIWKQESGERKRVQLAPFYVVWENLDDEKIRLEDDYGWPYQVVAVELIDARAHFPKMAPPEWASAKALEGFAAFRVHCSKCHPMNGEGGAIGPELNEDVSPVEYRRRAWLRRWIDDPSQVDPASRMPRLNPALPDRDETIDAILAYLEVMAEARRRPGPADAD